MMALAKRLALLGLLFASCYADDAEEVVTDISHSTISPRAVNLTWLAPKNSSIHYKQRKYIIKLPDSEILDEVEVEHIELEHLKPATDYNISIHVEYLTDEYIVGPQVFYRFRTVEETAIPVSNFTVKNVNDTNNIEINFDIETESEDSLGVIALVNLNPKSGTYEISVKTASHDHGKISYSIWKNATVPIKQIDPFQVNVVNRSSNSLTFQVTPSNPDKVDKNIVFFWKTSTKRTFKSSSLRFVLNNLVPYTTEVVDVNACYGNKLCSDSKLITATTNVAGPSAVQDLRGSIVLKTYIRFSWSVPREFNGPLDGYYVSLKSSDNDFARTERILQRNETSIKIATNGKHQTFTFTVKGFNKDLVRNGVVNGTEESVTVTIPMKRPSPPTDVTVTFLSKSSVEICWNKPNGTNTTTIDGYVLFLNTSESASSHNATSMGNTTSTTISGLDANVEYHGMIQAYSIDRQTNTWLLSKPTLFDFTIKSASEHPWTLIGILVFVFIAVGIGCYVIWKRQSKRWY